MKAILFIDQHYQEDIHLEDVAQIFLLVSPMLHV